MKNSLPKISIIVPVYNAEEYLPNCIDSILTQTFTDFELLLIDDGSTDNSGRICNKYAVKDSRVKVFHKQNGGASSARNVGLDNAKGEWIAFADADDWADCDWLYNFIQNLDCDIVVQGFYKHKNEKRTEFVVLTSNNPQYLPRYNYFEYISTLFNMGNIGYLWCRLFKAKIIRENNIRFDNRITLCEDLEFIFNYLTKTQCSCIQTATCYHYKVPNFNVKYTNKQHSIISLKCFYNILNCYVSLVGYKDSPFVISIINHYINCLIHIVREGRFSQIEEFSIFIRKCIWAMNCIQHLSIRSRIYLCIDRIQNRNLSYKTNSFFWRIVRKYI